MNRRLQLVCTILTIVTVLAPSGACMRCDLSIGRACGRTQAVHSEHHHGILKSENSLPPAKPVSSEKTPGHHHSRCEGALAQSRRDPALCATQGSCCHDPALRPISIRAKVAQEDQRVPVSSTSAFRRCGSSPVIHAVRNPKATSPPPAPDQALLCVFLI